LHFLCLYLLIFTIMKTSKKSLSLSLMLLIGVLVGCKENFKYQELESSYFIGNWEWSNTFTPTITIKHKITFDENGKGKMTSPDGLILRPDGRLNNFEWVFNRTDSTLLINQEQYKIIEYGKNYFVWEKGVRKQPESYAKIIRVFLNKA
jgi:hypothetical protein